MIKNADELGIDLESVSSNYGGKNVWSAQQTFEFSQLNFETTKMSDDDKMYKEDPQLIQIKNSNIEAAIEISNVLKLIK